MKPVAFSLWARDLRFSLIAESCRPKASSCLLSSDFCFLNFSLTLRRYWADNLGMGMPATGREGVNAGRELRRIKQLEDRLRQMQSAVVFGLSQLLDLKDLDTGVHSTRLAEWAVRVAEVLGLDKGYQHDVQVAALLHDIGKIGVPDSILQKKGPLTREEREQINKHPEYGWAILRLIPGFERASLFVLHHHERVDGQGYPAGLQGEEIPLGSRIVSLVDAFDAMISTRPYRAGMPVEEALRRAVAASGKQFDSAVVEHFVRLALDELPYVSRIREPLKFSPPVLLPLEAVKNS